MRGDQVGELAEARGIIHRAQEIDDAVGDPGAPILTYAVIGAGGVGEHSRGDLHLGLDSLDARVDGRDQPSDLSAAPVEEGVAQRACREDAGGPVGDGLPGLALETGGAAGAVAIIAVGIADVVEVDAVHVIVADNFEHGIGFEREVVGVGGAEPVDGRAAAGNLSAVAGAQAINERLRCADEVPVDLPNMDLQALRVGGADAGGELVAVVGEDGRVRQKSAVVVSHATAEHVGEHGAKSVRHQDVGRCRPVAGKRPGGVSFPKGAELRCDRLQAQVVGLSQMVLRGLSREDRLRVIGCGQGGDGKVAVGGSGGEFRFDQGRAEGVFGSLADAGHGFGISTVRSNAANPVDRAGGSGRPDVGQEIADQTEQRVGLPVGIVAKQDVGDEETVVAGQPSRVASRGAVAVLPGGADAGVEAVCHGVGDVPRSLLHPRRQIRNGRVGKNPGGEISRGPARRAHAEQRLHARGQEVIDEELAAGGDEAFQGGPLGSGDVFVVGQNHEPALR